MVLAIAGILGLPLLLASNTVCPAAPAWRPGGNLQPRQQWTKAQAVAPPSSQVGRARVTLIAASKNARQWQVGSKVEAWNIIWYPATVIEVGTGEHAGYYYVHYQKFSAASDQWIKASNIRAAVEGNGGAAAVSARSSHGPRLGKYLIYSYGAVGNTLFLGHFELQSGGRYRASRLSSGGYYGSGRYLFDAKASSVKWLSGPYKADGWGGKFSVEREGKTDRIEMRPRTIATHSTDS